MQYYQTARNSWKVLKKRFLKEVSELVTFCNRLKMQAYDGKIKNSVIAVY